MSTKIPEDISQFRDEDSANRLIIIGGGIVGSGIAKHLSTLCPSLQIIVVDTSFSSLIGSTGHAPGIVGQVNEVKVLTKLAVESVRQYSLMPKAFDKVGGLEIASTSEGIESLKRRARLADEAGLKARIISSEEAASLAPEFHEPDKVSSALLFEEDGTADARQITSEYRRLAELSGVAFIETKVLSISHEKEVMNGVETSLGFIKASRVVVATGIWTSSLLKHLGVKLPIVPVAHPYVHGPRRNPRSKTYPFVRYPEHHLYARDHCSFDGFGSYNHRPILSKIESATAIDSWLPEFDDVLRQAMKQFPRDGSDIFPQGTMTPFNGVFAMTPDGLPLVGEIEGFKGLWVAAAVWITHAGGAASTVANLLIGNEVDETVRMALDPNRFIGEQEGQLQDKALGLYNDIWHSLGASLVKDGKL